MTEKAILENELKVTTRSNLLDIMIMIIAIGGALYHVVATQYLFYSSIEHQNTHLAFALILTLLATLKKKKRHRIVSAVPILLAIAATIAATGYVLIFYEDLTTRAGFPSVTDVVIGCILVFLALEACRQAYGWILPILSIMAILYFIFGHHLPGILGHGGFSLPRIVSFLGIGFSGIYGQVLHVSALYIILFLLFGGLLRASSIDRFFIEIGKIAGGRLAGGPALTAVISSGLVGTVTGAPAANVAITGTFTIPTMKKAGFKSEVAGAVESVASTGGAIMPPVMGGTAFLVAAFANVPYVTVCIMAIIPALLYYWSCGVYCQLIGLRKGRTYYEVDTVDVEQLKRGWPGFIIPVMLLIFLLAKGFSAQYAIAWTMAALLVIALSRKGTRGTLRGWVQGITEAMISAAHIGAASACIGLLVAVVQSTGLGIKLPEIVELLSGGSFVFSLVLTAIVTLILGCGLPGPAAYVMAALVCAPILVKMGLAPLIAHFFIFFYAVLAAITPPVGIASLVASRMAGASYFATGFQGIKAVAIAWVIPFFFMWCPSLIMMPWEAQRGIPALFAIIIGQPFCTALLVNQLLLPLSLLERILTLLSVLGLWGFVFSSNYVVLVAGLLIALLTVSSQWTKYRQVPNRQGKVKETIT